MPTEGSEPATERVLILGVGNVLWADEGFGVRCVEIFAETFETPPEVSLVDGGTQGLYLVDLLREHERVLVFDCIDFGDEPGTMRVVRDDDVPVFISQNKMSLHQAGLQDVLATAALLGAPLKAVTLVGVQAVEFDDWGGSLRPAVRARIPDALAEAEAELRRWGVPVTRRAAPVERPDVGTPELAMTVYEAERPSAETACRFGDDRVLAVHGLPHSAPGA